MQPVLLFARADFRRQLIAVHQWHVAIGREKGMAAGCMRRERL
jgi:hypothetical protein